MPDSSRPAEGASYVGPPKPDFLDQSRDLVERLRQLGDPGIADECTYEELDRASLYDEAADEIERLRSANAALRWFVAEYESVLRAIDRLDIIDGVNSDFLK